MLPFPSNIGNIGMRRGKAVPLCASWPLLARWKKTLDLCLCWMEWTSRWGSDEGLLHSHTHWVIWFLQVKKNLKENTCSVWEIRFTLEKTFWHYRKSMMSIVSLDPSDAKGLTSSSREEQLTASISAWFGLYSKLRKQKTGNTYFPPKRCALLLIASLPSLSFPSAAAAHMGLEQPCPTVAMSSQHRLSFSSPLQRCSSWAISVECEEMHPLSVMHRAAITTAAKFETHWRGFQLG